MRVVGMAEISKFALPILAVLIGHFHNKIGTNATSEELSLPGGSATGLSATGAWESHHRQSADISISV
jgi:hypothetical protein